MENFDIVSMRKKAHSLEPLVRIGKLGITEGIIREICMQLKQHHLVKIRLLRAFINEHDKREVAEEIALKTNSVIVIETGFNIVLYKV